MRFALTILTLISLSQTAHAADALHCDLARGTDRLPLSADLVEDQAEVQTKDPNSLSLALDVSLSGGSTLFVLNDDSRQRRVAFTGSPQGLSTDEALLESGPVSLRCHKNLAKPSFDPPAQPERPDYFACVMDKASFENGAPTDSARLLDTVTSPLNAHLPITVKSENAEAAFTVKYTSFDPFHGLDVQITDKATGETAHYSGPARSMGPSFMFGLTLGNRDVKARFLRLGCVWTDNPKSFKTP
ncbi:MAG: hypothetical protein ACXVCI_05735 [Bdellovibrionota bacterium]